MSNTLTAGDTSPAAALKTFDIKAIVVDIATAVIRLHSWHDSSTLKLGQYTCNVEAKGRLHRLEWVWDGRCSCRELSVSVEVKHYKSEDGAKEHAVEEMVHRLSDDPRVTPEQWKAIIADLGPENKWMLNKIA